MNSYQSTSYSSYQPGAITNARFNNESYSSSLPQGYSSWEYTKTQNYTSTQPAMDTHYSTGFGTQLYQDKNSSLYRSHLYEHNKNQNNEKLYEPLRNVITHPEIVSSHHVYNEHAIKSSHVSHQHKHLSSDEYRTIVNQSNYLEREYLYY